MHGGGERTAGGSDAGFTASAGGADVRPSSRSERSGARGGVLKGEFALAQNSSSIGKGDAELGGKEGGGGDRGSRVEGARDEREDGFIIGEVSWVREGRKAHRIRLDYRALHPTSEREVDSPGGTMRAFYGQLIGHHRVQSPRCIQCERASSFPSRFARTTSTPYFRVERVIMMNTASRHLSFCNQIF